MYSAKQTSHLSKFTVHSARFSRVVLPVRDRHSMEEEPVHDMIGLKAFGREKRQLEVADILLDSKKNTRMKKLEHCKSYIVLRPHRCQGQR